MRIIRSEIQAPIEPLREKVVAVVGFGNQGHAHALNLRDSGVNVVIGARPQSAGNSRARELGFEPHTIEDAVRQADLIILALPDEAQPDIYNQQIAPYIKSGSTIGFIHGFNIRYEFIKPGNDLGVVMVAPKGPGHTLRKLYEQGKGLPSLFALHQDSPNQDAESFGLAWANGIGSARAAIVYTTFADETETDLFGEQAVLCGGIGQLIVAAFETLTEAGYPPELAYIECCHEVKQIADLVYERGLAGMYEMISNTAEFGAYRAGPIVVDGAVRERLREILSEIKSGEFATAMRDDYTKGFTWFKDQQKAAKQHSIEAAGDAVRKLMPWLAENSQISPAEPKKS